MSAAQYNFSIAQGEDSNFSLQVNGPTGSPIVLTTGGQLFKAEIREAHKKPLACTIAVTASSTVVGSLLFVISKANSLALDVAKNYQWDFFWTDGGGTTHKLLYGNVTVIGNITHV